MSRRKYLLTATLLAGALVVAGLLVETLLRVYASSADTMLAQALTRDPFAVLVEPHGEAGFRPRPNHSFAYPWMGSEAHTNSMAFRGPTVTVPKPAGTVRILLSGGSTTFGWGVNDDETIDFYMREMLSLEHPDREIEVVNLGFDGYDSYQVFERLRTEGQVMEPDFVIVNSGINDVRNAWWRDIRDGDRRTLLYLATIDQLRHEQARGGPTPWTRIKHWSYLARLPGWWGQRRRFAMARAAAEDQPPPEYYWDALDYFERNLRRVLELRDVEWKSPVVLFSTPPSSLLTFENPSPASYWLHDAQSTQLYRDSLAARMEAVAGTAGPGVRYVRLEPFPPDEFLDGAHLSPSGNRRIAAAFVKALEPWLNDPSGP